MEIVKEVLLRVVVMVLSLLVFFLITSLFFGGKDMHAMKAPCGCGGHGKEEKKPCSCNGGTKTTEAKPNPAVANPLWTNINGQIIG